MKKLVHLSVLVLVSTTICVTSCKKAEVDTETQTAVDNSIADNMYSQVFPSTHRIVIADNGVKPGSVNRIAGTDTLTSCAQITDVSAFGTFPFTFTIDYGAGCTDPHDARFRKGKLKVSLDNYWNQVGSTLTITFDEYYDSNIKLKGKIVVKHDALGQYTVSVVDGACETEKWNIKYASSHTFKWLQGFDTEADVTDDVIEVTGNSNGVNRKDLSFTSKITSPLIKAMNCKWVQKGKIELTPEGKSARTLDFGDGKCDNKAKITVNGNTYDFEM